MSEVDTINAFLQRTDHSATELAIKQQLIATDAALKENNKAREELVNTLKQKETEFLKLAGSLDSQIKLILELSKLDTNPFTAASE